MIKKNDSNYSIISSVRTTRPFNSRKNNNHLVNATGKLRHCQYQEGAQARHTQRLSSLRILPFSPFRANLTSVYYKVLVLSTDLTREDKPTVEKWISSRFELQPFVRANQGRNQGIVGCGYVVYTPEVGNVVGGNVVKREAFVDSVAIESVDLKDKFCSRVLRPFVMPW